MWKWMMFGTGMGRIQSGPKSISSMLRKIGLGAVQG